MNFRTLILGTIRRQPCELITDLPKIEIYAKAITDLFLHQKGVRVKKRLPIEIMQIYRNRVDL